jgi:Predicted RNA-binding protein homologous to eukaryotic snRNP
MEGNSKFRKYLTSSGKLVLAGKNAEQNEEIVPLASKKELVFHTKEVGSPFCVIKTKNKLSKRDIEETAVFCAKYSKYWRDNHRDVVVHFFKASDIFKDKSMKAGTFGVKKYKEITIKKQDIERFEEEQK